MTRRNADRATARRRRGERRPPLLGREERRIRFGLFGLATALLLGTVGYQVIEGTSLVDAIYMTVITISTVGFGEVVPLDSAGKLLTVSIIFIGVVSASFAAVSTAEFVLEGHLRHAIEVRRMTKAIRDLSDHVVVCGFGRVGVHVVSELLASGRGVVVIDSDPEKVSRLAAQGILYVAGDATEERALEEAGIATASAVVAAVNGDADNVLITLTAKGLRSDIQVIARAKADENEGKLRRAGADRVVAPTTIGGLRIAHVLTRPIVADFLDRMAAGAIDVLLEEVPVPAGSDLAGTMLRDAGIRERYGCTVMAVQQPGESLTPSPSADTVIQPGATVLVLGPEEQLTAMRAHYLG